MALEHRQIAPVHAVQYALRVLEAVDNHRHGVTTEQLAREVGVPVEYLGDLLTMLKRERYVDERVLLSHLESHPPTAPSLDLQEYAIGTVCAAIPVTIGKHVGCLALSLPVTEAHRLKPAADVLNERAAPMMLALTM